LRRSGLVTPRQLVIRERRPWACTTWRGNPESCDCSPPDRLRQPATPELHWLIRRIAKGSRKSLRCRQPHL
jgi:hypothetical protein